jgi:hypothetical protein
LAHLRDLRAVRSSQVTWRAGAVLTSVFALISSLLLTGIALVTHPPFVPVLAGAGVIAVPFAFAAIALFKAKGLEARVSSLLDDAWVSAAHDVADRRGVLRIDDLTADFRIDKDLAHKLISRLASDSDVKTEITDAGELSLSVRAERLRVADAPAASESEQPAPETEINSGARRDQTR